MTSEIQNMWMVVWHVPFNQREQNLSYIEDAADNWADAVCMFEVEDSPPSGEYDHDGLPIASLHVIEAYGRSNPHNHPNMQTLFQKHQPDKVTSVVENPTWLDPQPPRQVERFWIDATGLQKPGLWTLAIHSATAFGSGEHPTTIGCLTLMDRLQKRNHDLQRVLDLGCGSGILAIAAHYLWPQASISAVDIDPEAIRVTERHAAEHHCTLNTYVGDGCQTGSYDLIVANILLNPLLDMTNDIARIGTRYLITSGILESQASQLEKAYHAGWRVSDRCQIQDWTSLFWERIAS